MISFRFLKDLADDQSVSCDKPANAIVEVEFTISGIPMRAQFDECNRGLYAFGFTGESDTVKKALSLLVGEEPDDDDAKTYAALTLKQVWSIANAVMKVTGQPELTYHDASKVFQDVKRMAQS